MPDVTALSMTDAQPKAGPALSATSDMPEVKAAPPPVSEEVNKTEAAKAEAEAAAVAAAAAASAEADAATKAAEEAAAAKKASEEGDGEETEEAELPPKFKAQITRQRGLRRAADARAAAAEAKADAATANLTKAMEGIENLTKAQAKLITEKAEQEDPRPNRETYEDPTKYEADLVAWAGRRAAMVAKAEAEKTVSDKLAADKAETDKKTQAEANQRLADDFAERKAKFIEAHPDYEEVAEAEDLQISMPMAAAILNDEDGPAIAYYLGQNPDEAERISKIASGTKQIAELGRIAARLALKPAPATKPAPIKPLKAGTEAAVAKTPSEMSMEEYGAQRTRALANDRRARMGLAPLN